MAKYIAFGVAASIDPHTGGQVEATFYRKGIIPAWGERETDWEQTHTNLTRASRERLWRFVDNGSVVIGPDRISVYKDVVNGRPVPTPGLGAECEWFPVSQPPPEKRRNEEFLVVTEDKDGTRAVEYAESYREGGFWLFYGYRHDDAVLWSYFPPAPPKAHR